MTYPEDKPTLAGSLNGTPIFSYPELRPGEFMGVPEELGPDEFYAVDGKALNLYRTALGARPLTDDEIAALPRTEDGLIVVSFHA